MALAENNHHSAPRRPTIARAREEESDEMNNAFGQKTLLSRAASTMYYRMDDGDVLAARPSLLAKVLPRCTSSRHSCLLQKIDTPSVEQVIAVPKLSLDRISQRSAVRRPQTAEQLVEVPTVLSYALLQERIAAKH